MGDKTQYMLNSDVEKVISSIENSEIQNRVRDFYVLTASVKDSPTAIQSVLKLSVDKSKHPSGEMQWIATISNLSQNIAMQQYSDIKRDTKSYCESYNPDKKSLVFTFLMNRPLKRAKRDKFDVPVDGDYALCGTGIPITYDQTVMQELNDDDIKHVDSISDLLVGKYFMCGKNLKAVVMGIHRDRNGKTHTIDIEYRNATNAFDLTRITGDSTDIRNLMIMPSIQGIGLRMFIRDLEFGDEKSGIGQKRKLGTGSDLFPQSKRII